MISILPDYFKCDLKHGSLPLPHFWEHTIGSGHAALALRSDWQSQLLRSYNELGFKHVRFHGILSDNMGTLVCENEKLIYSFFNSDQIFDFLLSIGMFPFVECSFMPSTLASGSQTVFSYRDNVTPPKDYEAWQTLITTIVRHWIERYGIENMRKWYFEIWNEPNLHAFWTGSQQEYFLLYQHAANAIKAIDSQLQVGGPATASNSWITAFIDYCNKHKVPFDFISTHHYPTDAFGKPGDDTITQLADSKRSILREQVIDTRKKSGTKPVYYTEWSTSSNPFDDLHDLPYAAAFIIKTIMEARGQVQGYSYWTFSDIFDENYFSSVPFHGGFGLLTIHGIAKPAYRAFQLLHQLGNIVQKVEGEHPTIDVWVITKESLIQVLITNFALPRHPVMSELVRIKLENIEYIKTGYIERIDDTHANSRPVWVNMGRPESLKPDQLKTLEATSLLVKEPVIFSFENKAVSLEIEVPPQGTSLVTLETI